MIRRDVDPKETHARPVFRFLGVLLFLGMAALFFLQSLPFLMQPGRLDVGCPAQRRDIECELGAMLVRALPAEVQRTVVGIGGMAAAAGVLIVGWLILRPRKG